MELFSTGDLKFNKTANSKPVALQMFLVSCFNRFHSAIAWGRQKPMSYSLPPKSPGNPPCSPVTIVAVGAVCPITAAALPPNVLASLRIRVLLTSTTRTQGNIPTVHRSNRIQTVDSTLDVRSTRPQGHEAYEQSLFCTANLTQVQSTSRKLH